MFLVWGADRVLFYNDGCAAAFGRKHPAAFGRNFWDVWPELRVEGGPLFERVFRGEGVLGDRLRVVSDRGDQAARALACTCTPIHDEHGAVAGVLCPCTAIPAGLEEVANPGLVDARLAQLFEQGPSLMAMLVGPRHRIEMANPAFLRFIGNRAVIGEFVAEALPDAVEQGYLDILDRVFESAQAIGSTGSKYTVRNGGDGGAPAPGNALGEDRFVDFVCQPIVDRTGTVVGIFVEGADVTERTRAENRLRRGAETFRHLVENNPFGIYVIDADFCIVHASREARRAFAGVEPLIGRDFGEAMRRIWPERVARLVIERIRATLATGEPYAMPSSVERRADSGEVEAYDWRIERIVRPDDRFGVVFYFYDLTERKRWEEQLLASEDRLNIALRAANAGVFDWNIETGDIVWSEGHFTLLGLEPRSQTPDYALWRRHVHPDDVDRVERAIAAAIDSGDYYRIDYRVVCVDGVERWIQAQGLLIERPDHSRRMVGVVVDIHERKRAEQTLREADARKDEFLATLSHELRNPLAPLRTAARLLNSPDLPPEELVWVRGVIERQVGHMAWLLDDLLDIARITQGKLELKKRAVGLPGVIEAAGEAVRPMMDAKHHRLELSLPAEPVSLEADPVRLAQILSNLLTNAAKYTDDGGRISLSARVLGDALRLSIKDNGIGIAAACLPRVFDMFAQIDGGASRSEGGLGIGLALVKGLVQLHGGSVTAESAGTGLGSEFTVCLPLPMAASEPPPQPAGEQRSTSRVRRILIADDNADAADSLAMLLELDGHEVRVAHAGREALEIAGSFLPDVALLDIGMPELNGYAVAKELRREPWGDAVHLIALTGWGQEEDRQRARDAGFDHHMTKPIDLEELEKILSA